MMLASTDLDVRAQNTHAQSCLQPPLQILFTGPVMLTLRCALLMSCTPAVEEAHRMRLAFIMVRVPALWAAHNNASNQDHLYEE